MSTEAVFVARQPIYDLKGGVWGFELLFRHSGDAISARVKDPAEATSQVIADGFVLAQPGLGRGRKALVNFPRELLLAELAFALPPAVCVIEILETVRPEADVLAALRRLKDGGYTLALDDFVGQPGFDPLLDLADIVKVDVKELTEDGLRRLTARLRRPGRRLLAEKVETARQHELTKSLGYSLFQGYHLSRPEIIAGRKPSSSQLSKLQIIKELSGEDFDMVRLTALVSTDVPLSYRLLRYVNSPSFGARGRVDSIERAVALLGRRPFALWLRAVFLAELNPAPQAEETAFLSVMRARFLELLAQAAPAAPFPAETMFLLGLFSLLDRLLRQPMADILALLPMDESLAASLLGRFPPVKPWLALVEACEEADWDQASAALRAISLPAGQAARVHAQALTWTRDALGLSSGLEESAA